MQQFRPLPKFGEIEEAEPVEVSPVRVATKGPVPILFSMPNESPSASTEPLPLGTEAPSASTGPIITGTGPVPILFPGSTGPIPTSASTNPIPMPGLSSSTTGQMPLLGLPLTTGQVPVVLLSGPQPGSDTDRLAALIKQSTEAHRPTSLTEALQAAMNPAASTSRFMVIPADPKRKKQAARRASAPTKHLNPRLRHSVILLAVVGIFIATLATLAPLSDNNNGNIFTALNNLVQTAQMNWTVQAHQSMSQVQATPDLPFMNIPNSPYVATAQDAANAAGISPLYFVRQINQESQFNPNALSPAGAEGIAQFEPATAADYGVDPWNPTQALYGAARMMADLYHKYGDYAKALAAYNAGPGNLQGAVNACGVNWLDCVPGETRHYVYIIMGI